MRERLTNKIGEGSHRTVYEHPDDPKLVVKVPCKGRKDGRSYNYYEWHVWMCLRNTPDSRLLAPCVDTAPDYSWIVMQRVELTDKCFLSRPYKKDCRDWMDDIKPKNCGMIGEQLVLLDYGSKRTAKRLGIPLEIRTPGKKP